jgi:hypothetical protein
MKRRKNAVLILLGPRALIRALPRLILSRRKNVSAIFLTTLYSLLMSSCTEELPPYRRPGAVFSTRIVPFYGLTATENKLHFFLTAKNIYDETLSGPASLTGQVQLISTADPSVVKTFEVTSANITVAEGYFPDVGTIAIDPGKTVAFDVAWDLSKRPLLDDSGKDLTQGLLRMKDDPSCPQRRKRSDPQDFLVEGYVVIFARIGPAIANNVSYRFCLVSSWAGQNDCPPAAAPCNLVLSGGN